MAFRDARGLSAHRCDLISFDGWQSCRDVVGGMATQREDGMAGLLSRRRLLVECTTAVALGGVATHGAAAQPTSLKVMGFPGSSNLTFFAAQHKGLFAKHGLSAELLFTP